MTDLTPAQASRRRVLRAAAWSAPVIAVVSASPAYADSGAPVNVGAYSLDGTCGILGVEGPGFTLTAGPAVALPVGTIITINGSGVSNIGSFSVTGGSATVAAPSNTSRVITLTAALPPGATMAMRTTLSISVAFNLTGGVALPTGFVATGAKTSGTVSSTLILCSAG